MTKSEVARLLAMIAAFDRRTIGESDVEAWHLILGGLEVADCAAAVREHYTAKRDWIMPADVRNFAEDESRRRKGRIRRAEQQAQIERENSGELHQRSIAPLTAAGQAMPSALMRDQVSKHRREATEVDVAARTREAERREQARREVAERHASATGETT